jgi:glycogen phosphorylase
VTPFPALDRIVQNLWWTWTPDARALVESVHPRSWRDARGFVVDYLAAVPEERWEQLRQNRAFQASLRDIEARLTDYLHTEQTWWNNNHAGDLPGGVALFSAEWALHEGLPLYSGALGILAADHLKSASDLGVPTCAVGLFYREGYFSQQIDRWGCQTEDYVGRTPASLGLVRAKGAGGQPLEVFVPLHDGHLRCEVWKTCVGRVPLYLLDADVEGNPFGDRWLSKRLYGGDPTNRIKQEIVLGIGGIRALRAAGHAPDVIHLNEGHTSFAVLERLKEELDRGLPAVEAWDEVRRGTVFTTHTPLADGHDRFWSELVSGSLGSFLARLQLSTDEVMDLGRVETGSDEQLCMTVVGLKGSRAANAVSERHGEVSRVMWEGVDRPGSAPIDHVTGGVHAASWVGPEIQRVLDQYVGKQWRRDQRSPHRMLRIEDVPKPPLWEAHLAQKQRLIQFVAHRTGKRIDSRSLIVGFAQRFADFKRGDLILSEPSRLAGLLNDDERPVVLLYAGKSHPRDGRGKRIIQRVLDVASSPDMDGKIIFLPDHDIASGRMMVQGADVWLNSSRRTLEATGIAGQKAAMNGGLNCSTLAGWWMEGYQLEPMAGWAVGRAPDSDDLATIDRQDAEDLYRTFEEEIVPLYWDRAGDGLPDEWVWRMSAAMAACLPAFNTDRMVADYVTRSYLGG